MAVPSRFTLGANVQSAREAGKWSLRGLARRAGVSPATLSAIERGDASPTIRTAERIAGGLDISLRALLSETETAAAIRRGPKSRVMLRAKVSGSITAKDGSTFEVRAGKDLIDVDHHDFQTNPELRRHFELVDVTASLRKANVEREKRKLGEVVQAKSTSKPRTRRTRYSIP